MGQCACNQSERENNELFSANLGDRTNARSNGGGHEDAFAETGDHFNSSKAHFRMSQDILVSEKNNDRENKEDTNRGDNQIGRVQCIYFLF